MQFLFVFLDTTNADANHRVVSRDLYIFLYFLSKLWLYQVLSLRRICILAWGHYRPIHPERH